MSSRVPYMKIHKPTLGITSLHKLVHNAGKLQNHLGAVHKSVRSQGVCPVRTWGVLQMRTSILWRKKLRIFRNLWCVRTKRGGWASADILRTRGVKFSRFCTDVFYGRPLIILIYHYP